MNKNSCFKDIKSILIDENEIDEIVRRIADEISRDYRESVESGSKLLLLCILKGSVMFMGDLMKRVSIPVEIDFMRYKSYIGTESQKDSDSKIEFKRDDLPETDIIIVEDIIDTGRTLSKLTEALKQSGAKSVRICTLLDKPSRRDPEVTIKPDYTGKIIPNEFVVGYGLDFDEKYRALPYVGILKPSAYESLS